MEFPPELSMDAFTHASQTARQRGLEQLLRGAGAGAGAQQARAGPGYTLRAVVTHSGGISSGHYITYRRGPIGSKQVQYQTTVRILALLKTLSTSRPYTPRKRRCRRRATRRSAGAQSTSSYTRGRQTHLISADLQHPR